MKLVALKRVKYPHGPSGREYAPGEEFEALSDRDAKALTLVGKAQASAPKKNVTDLPPVRTAALKAEEPAETPEAEDDGAPLERPRRQYRRRDMKAED